MIKVIMIINKLITISCIIVVEAVLITLNLSSLMNGDTPSAHAAAHRGGSRGGPSGHAPLGTMAGLAIVILYVDIINVFLLL